MLQINQELEEKLKKVNSTIRENYMSNVNVLEIRKKIEEKVNIITKISKNNSFGKSSTLVGVDGSINTLGLTFPHYISLMRAIAKSTSDSNNSVSICDIHTPLIDKSYLSENPKKLPYEVVDEKTCSNKMALLELHVALESIDKLHPNIIFMDGSLTRFYNVSKQKWKNFINKAHQNNIIVVGIIEEIRTSELSSRLCIDSLVNMYDRDILFGTLEQGEMFLLNDWDVDGINKCFMRASKDPLVIGIDFMKYDEPRLSDVLSLIFALTPYDGRGIPLWLDIVDNEVKLTDSMTKALVETYIDKDIVEKLIRAKRENRKL